MDVHSWNIHRLPHINSMTNSYPPLTTKSIYTYSLWAYTFLPHFLGQIHIYSLLPPTFSLIVTLRQGWDHLRLHPHPRTRWLGNINTEWRCNESVTTKCRVDFLFIQMGHECACMCNTNIIKLHFTYPLPLNRMYKTRWTLTYRGDGGAFISISSGGWMKQSAGTRLRHMNDKKRELG